jgi:hypothetical protein
MPNPVKDISGQRFGKRVVLRRGESTAHGDARWWVRCDCGREELILGYALRRGEADCCRKCAEHLLHPSRPIRERIMEKVKIGPIPEYRPDLGPCWLFTGSLNPDGYGVISVQNVSRSVHREMYQDEYGVIVPPKLQVDHLCRVHNCCNPKHLEPVTSQENQRRGSWCIKAA